MKHWIPIILLGASTLMLPAAYAEEQPQDHEAHHPEQQQTSTDTQATLQKADEKIAELSALQKEADKATSPQEQKAIQAKQMMQMQECMSMMNMMSQSSQMMMKPEEMMMRQQMLEKRMDMMQMMMQTMLNQQASPATGK